MRQNFKRVLLVNPAYSRSYFSIPVLPAGLGYLAESLKSNNIAYRVFDMSLGYKARDLAAAISDFCPDLIGISCISYMLKDTYNMVGDIKRNSPSVRIVMGGPHVSSIKDAVLRECPELDFAIAGEGEHALIELCKNKPLNQIKGLIYNDNGSVVFTGEREFIDDLDSLSFPKFDHFELRRYGYRMISIVTSRGCPYSCIYCSCNVIGKKIRFRSADNITDEIEYWYRLGYREFGIQEDNPTFDRGRMLEICRKIHEKGLYGLKLMCGNGVRADKVDRELLVAMKHAGFKRLAFGIESGSDKVLKAIKKGSRVSDMDKAVKEATDLGFFVSLFFLVGSPSETSGDVEESIKFALKYPVQCVDFFNIVPIPGSELYRWVKDNNYFLREPSEYLNAKYHPARSVEPIFQTPEFSRPQRKAMLKKTKQVSKMIRRRALENRFMRLGYFGKIMFFIYCTDAVNRIENAILANDFLRNTIGEVRLRLRNMFYE